MVVVGTERLVLREVADADAPFILELLNTAGFIDNIGDRGVRTLDGARAYIVERVTGSYVRHGFGMWAVDRRSDAATIGLAGLVRREGLSMPDLGYAFLPSVWGQGYAREAAAAVLAHAQSVLGLTALAAITGPENHASMAVLRKIGFIDQGTIHLPGDHGESAYFTT